MFGTPVPRTNFRSGGVDSVSSPGGKPGSFRRDFPTKPRRRLQVGTTNISKCASAPSLPGRTGSPEKREEDPAAAAPYLSETNIELVKASLRSGNTQFNGFAKVPTDESASLVVESAQRRRQSGESLAGKYLKPIHTSRPATTPSDAVEDLKRCDAESHPRVPSTEQPTLSPSFPLEMARVKLRDSFMDKYGSMRAVFRAFDSDANGMISAQRFYDMVEAAEVDLTTEQVRQIYRSADTNGDNTMEYQEFLQLFTGNDPIGSASNSAFSPLKQSLDLVSDPSSSLALKYRTPLELSPRSRRRMKQLRVQVTDELSKKHGEALSVQGGKYDLLLAYAFKNLDSDNDGFLSYDQVEGALGSDYLRLGISSSDMADMIHLMDRNSDQKISMREFVHYFAVGAREPPTDLIDNARKKELAALHAKMTVQLTPREEIDPHYGVPIEPTTSPTADEHVQAPGCMQEQLARRTADAVKLDSPSEREHQYSRRLPSSLSVPSLRPSTTPVTTKKQPEDDVRMIAAPHDAQDRFWRKRMHRMDWTRVGIGGDGACPESGLFLHPSDRFETTSAAAFSPITRAFPSDSVDDAGSNTGSVAIGKGGIRLVREAKSLATAEHEARCKLRVARDERTNFHLTNMQEARVREERLRDWKARARVRRTAGEKFLYLDHLQEIETRVAAREAQMRKRHGGAAFLRMWAGSADSQFNSH